MIAEYINEHIAGFWITIGFVLLALEVLILGFGTVIFMFAGIGCVATGVLILTGLLPETWIASIASAGILTGVTSVLLWKPFRSMQEGSQPKAGSGSDLIGLEFALGSDVSRADAGTHRYSGVDWRVELDADSGDDALAAGTRVRVTGVDAGLFRVISAAGS